MNGVLRGGWPAILTAFVGLIPLVGCGSSEPAGTVGISGTVTLDGKAVSEAVVAFTSQGGSRLATTQTDSAGRFTIRPAAGKNAVSVAKGGAPVVIGNLSEQDMLMPTDTEYKKLPVPDTGIPAKYADPKTSGLVVDAVEGLDVDLSLSSK